MKRILSPDPDEVMPPPKDGKPLSAREIEILKKWIAQGAPYAEHWSFVKPVKPAPPKNSTLNSELSTPIDAFISAGLAENGLKMSAEAGPSRAGPPCDARSHRPAADAGGSGCVRQRHQPDAYERLVDRFLATPAYGERWARMWLDLARYADSAGYGSDPLRPNIWPYRDWVINAFNRNLPFDQFTHRAARRRPAAERDDRADRRPPRSTATR